VPIKRTRLDRKVDLVMEGDRVVDRPPGWHFTVKRPNFREKHFDFTPLRAGGRDDLAGHMRDAIWSLRHVSEGQSLESYFQQLDRFWRFLEDLARNGEVVTRLDQIDRRTLERYLAWLELQITIRGKNKGQPLSVGSKRAYFNVLKTLLINRRKHNPAEVNPLLGFPRNPFPNSNAQAEKRQPYSIGEQKRIMAALNADLRTIHEGAGEPLPDSQVLAVHLVMLGLVTGRNKTPLIELKRDSIQPHALPGRRFLLTYKRRGHTTHATSIRAEASIDDQPTTTAIPKNIAEHFEYLCQFTAPLMKAAAEENRNFAFLKRMRGGDRKGCVVRWDDDNAGSDVTRFSRRHDLKDDRGNPLIVNVARLRPSMGSALYRITKDIGKVRQALGHASVRTTQIYVETRIEAERDHSLVLESMEHRFGRQVVDGKVLIAADGQTPLQNAKDILSGGYNTGLARCKNPFRSEGSVCKKFLACFECPNMIVFEDDLWRLFSFYYRILSERPKINPDHWMKTYAAIIRRIDLAIAPQFPADKVAAARAQARTNPHPAWRGPLP